MSNPITVESEHKRLLYIAARLGRRLAYQIGRTGMHDLPPEEWVRAFAQYRQAVRATGDGAINKPADGTLTEEQYATEVALLARETVLDLSDVELERLLKERAAKGEEPRSVAGK